MNNVTDRSRTHGIDPRGELLPTAPPTPPFRREIPLSPAVDREGDRLLAQYVRNAAPAGSGTWPGHPAPPTPPLTPNNDRILYIGINPDSRGIESQALRTLRPDTKVVFAAKGDVVPHGGASFDLASPERRRAFAASLGLQGKVADDVVAVLEKARPDTRAILAQIASHWSAAERGAPVSSRLLLSGHSGGQSISGGDTQLDFTHLHALAKAMPRAARQVEDVHLSSCFTFDQARSDQTRGKWREAFPNMKTLWSYGGFAPAAPVHHFAAWEAATRGRSDRLVPAAWLRGQEVAAWSAKAGFVDQDVTPETMDRAKRAADAAFEGLLAGSPRIELPGDPRAALHYDTYRVLSKRDERSDTAALSTRANQLLAIRNYEPIVRDAFMRDHASMIERGYRALGLEPPDFRALTRAEALVQTRAFHEAFRSTESAPEAARLLEPILRGLDRLEAPVVRVEWSMHGARP